MWQDMLSTHYILVKNPVVLCKEFGHTGFVTFKSFLLTEEKRQGGGGRCLPCFSLPEYHKKGYKITLIYYASKNSEQTLKSHYALPKHILIADIYM